jgi:hypothetical protein
MMHADWIEADRSLVAQVKAALTNQPQHIDRVLPPGGRKNLGFGYALASCHRGAGYMGFSCEMLYSNDTLVSFRLAPGIGPQQNLLAIYADMLGDVFRTNHDGTFEPVCYKPEASTAALPGCELQIKMSTNMQFFCSPFSDIYYGTRGGYLGALLPNRRAYLKVAEEIDGLTCLRLLYSINPATRLTAYEHYRRNAKAMAPIRDQIESRMRNVFEEVPRIQTMRGCIVREEDSRQVLESILRAKANPESNLERIALSNTASR